MAEREVVTVENCPVCGEHTPSTKYCDICGFDDSCNYEAHMTLGPVPAGVRSLARMRLDDQQKRQTGLHMTPQHSNS